MKFVSIAVVEEKFLGEVEDDMRNVSFAYFTVDIQKVAMRFMCRSQVFFYFSGRE